MTTQEDTTKIEAMQEGAFAKTDQLDALTLLERVERKVKLPMPAARRRRFWLAWSLWGIFGATVTWSGAPQGVTLAMASILTAPLWLLFLAWPVLWIRDRLHARQWWAKDVRLLVDEIPEGGIQRQEDAVALPVIVGQENALVVPLEGWCTVFPEILREDLVRLGVEIWPAEKLSGVALEVIPAESLVSVVAALKKSSNTAASVAVQRWVASLEKVVE